MKVNTTRDRYAYRVTSEWIGDLDQAQADYRAAQAHYSIARRAGITARRNAASDLRVLRQIIRELAPHDVH